MEVNARTMEWLALSIGDCMPRGRLPHVPEARRLHQCLFPVRLHPRHAALEVESYLWAQSSLGTSAQEIQKMRHRGVASLPCYLWPTTRQPQRSLTHIKLMHWFTLVDEAVDEGAGLRGDVLAVEKLCKGLVQALVGADSTSEAAALLPAELDEEPLVVSVGRQWWEEVRRCDMPLGKQARFAAELTHYLMEQVAMARFRERLLSADTPAPGVEEYIVVRRAASAFPLGIAMVEYDMGDRLDQLDEETLTNPILQQLRDAVSDHASWLNDIISFPKEFVQGDFLSLLPLLHIRNNSHLDPSSSPHEFVPFRVAISQAWEMVAARERDCASLAHQILNTPHLAAKPGLEEYVEAVCGFTSGNWAWSLEVPAYNNYKHIAAPTSQHKIQNNISTGSPAQASLILPKKPYTAACFNVCRTKLAVFKSPIRRGGALASPSLGNINAHSSFSSLPFS